MSDLYINPDNGWPHCLSQIREVRAAEVRCGDLEKVALSYHLDESSAQCTYLYKSISV